MRAHAQVLLGREGVAGLRGCGAGERGALPHPLGRQTAVFKAAPTHRVDVENVCVATRYGSVTNICVLRRTNARRGPDSTGFVKGSAVATGFKDRGGHAGARGPATPMRLPGNPGSTAARQHGSTASGVARETGGTSVPHAGAFQTWAWGQPAANPTGSTITKTSLHLNWPRAVPPAGAQVPPRGTR